MAGGVQGRRREDDSVGRWSRNPAAAVSPVVSQLRSYPERIRARRIISGYSKAHREAWSFKFQPFSSPRLRWQCWKLISSINALMKTKNQLKEEGYLLPDEVLPPFGQLVTVGDARLSVCWFPG
jgi:hypothetical protein